MRIAVFGCGYIYDTYKDLIPDSDEIVVILDNDVTLHGQKKDGYIRVYPREISGFDVDRVIIMSDYAAEMREQLLRLDFPKEKIVHYNDYIGGLNSSIRYLAKAKNNVLNSNLLIISNKLGYHGGAVVSFRTAITAQRMGYTVSIAAPDADELFLNEIKESGIEIIIQRNLDNSSEENLSWTSKFDIVIVNTFPMILCAIRIARHKKVCVWLHESAVTYQSMEYWHDEIQKGLIDDNIELMAVTERAKENLLRFYTYKKSISIMSVPINDNYMKGDTQNHKPCSKKMNVVLCGAMSKHKGYDFAIKAIDDIESHKGICLYMVGKIFNDDYCQTILRQIKGRAEFCYVGEKSTTYMTNMYLKTDLVIVPSYEETFSMVAAEAMMMGKVCAVSDHCGIAEYIENGVNGFVFPRNDAKALKEIIIRCMNNREELKSIGDRARKTYVSCFSDGVFEKKINKMLMRMTKDHQQ